MPAILGWGVGTAVAMGVFEYTGGKLLNRKPEVESMNEWAVKEQQRTVRRKPIEDTIALVGEGRGKWIGHGRLSKETTVH